MYRLLGLLLMVLCLETHAVDGQVPPIQANPNLPAIEIAPTQAAPNLPKTEVQPIQAAPTLPKVIVPPTEPPPPKQEQAPLKVDWGQLPLFFYLSDAKVEQRFTTNILGQASVDIYFSFDVTARQQFSNLTLFSGRFFNASGHQILSMPLEFQPAPFEWTPGTRARAYVMMPDQSLGATALVFGTGF